MHASLSLANRNWSWFLVPMNASSTGISTILPIYIMALGGQVREVAIAMFLSNLAMTLGAIFWGRLIDVMHWRGTIISLCSAAVAVSAASMYFVSSISVLMVLSAVVGFFSIGPAPVTNLLVMERSRKEDWLKTFSWTSLISAVGLVIAMVAGYLWLTQYDAKSYSVACSAIAISSLALTIIFVKEPRKVPGSRRPLLRSLALYFGSIKMPASLRSSRAVLTPQKIRAGLSRKESIYFAGIGLYFLSGNLMFTPFTPFLKDNGVSDTQVFLAYTMLHLCKVVFLPFNHRVIALRGEEGMSKIAYLPRLMGIALAAAAALLIVANPGSILMITMLAFVGTEIGFSVWSTTTTSSLLKIIPAGQEGRILGINSAVIGAGLLIGALAAGEVSASFGYAASFILAIAIAILSFALVSKFFKKVKVAPPALA